MRLRNITIIVTSMVLAIYIWQVACEVNEWELGPAWGLVKVKLWANDFFECLGRWVAYISSYLHWLKLRTLWDALVHLVEPLIGILCSGFYFVKGYVLSAAEYTQTYMIYVGSGLLVILVGAVLWRYTNICARIKNGLNKFHIIDTITEQPTVCVTICGGMIVMIFWVIYTLPHPPLMICPEGRFGFVCEHIFNKK